MKLYGVPLSQPVRAVQWALAIHKTPHEFVPIMPGQKKKGGSQSPEFLEMNPTGTVPVLEDEGFFVWESHAILVYLATKLGWDDLYPKDAKSQAQIHQWFNWHHQNLRRVTLALFAPKFRPDIKRSEAEAKTLLATAHASVKILDGQLGKSRYLCGEKPTLADISAYEELGQVSESALNLFDFSTSPNVVRWMKDMEALPAWKEVHEPPMAMAKKILSKM